MDSLLRAPRTQNGALFSKEYTALSEHIKLYILSRAMRKHAIELCPRDIEDTHFRAGGETALTLRMLTCTSSEREARMLIRQYRVTGSRSKVVAIQLVRFNQVR